MTEDIYKTTKVKVMCKCPGNHDKPVIFAMNHTAKYTGPGKYMPFHCHKCQQNADYIHGSAQPEAHGIRRI